jgi:hypothetical protein
MTGRLCFLLSLAAVGCAQSPAIRAALATGSHFPLDVGNEWVYRIDSRAATAQYQTWRVDRTEIKAGVPWQVMQILGPGAAFAESWFRSDGQGRVYQPDGEGGTLFLDAEDVSAPAILKVTGRGGSYTGPSGSFTDTLSYRNQRNALTLETGTLVRGVGLVWSTEVILAGSSGGFNQGRTLVEATLAGGLRLGRKALSAELSMEGLVFDVSGGKVTNCAVPCYFAACGLVPGYDPPETYRPCAEARARVREWPGDAPPALVLRLTGPDGGTVWERTLGANAARGVAYLQAQLYSAPNQPLAPGWYRLRLDVDGGAAEASLAFEIR